MFFTVYVDKIINKLYNKTEERTVADGYALADLFTEEKNRLLGHFGRFFYIILFCKFA